jgi:hypothetical protein
MSRQPRRCDHCGRTIRKPGLIAFENIFCSAECKRRFPSVLRRRLIAHYHQMAEDAARWIAETLRWNESHPHEEPIDIESLRLVKFGAQDVVEALRGWGPIPQRALRLINSAMLGAKQGPRHDNNSS